MKSSFRYKDLRMDLLLLEHKCIRGEHGSVRNIQRAGGKAPLWACPCPYGHGRVETFCNRDGGFSVILELPTGLTGDIVFPLQQFQGRFYTKPYTKCKQMQGQGDEETVVREKCNFPAPFHRHSKVSGSTGSKERDQVL